MTTATLRMLAATSSEICLSGLAHVAAVGVARKNGDCPSLDTKLGIQRDTSDLNQLPLAQANENGGRQSPRAHNKQDQGNKQQDIHDPRFNQFHSSL